MIENDHICHFDMKLFDQYFDKHLKKKVDLIILVMVFYSGNSFVRLCYCCFSGLDLVVMVVFCIC